MVATRSQPQAKARAAAGASARRAATPEPEPEQEWTQVVSQFWLQLSNAYLWLDQRRRSAQGLRDLWSAYARLGNRLRRSHWEPYRHEFGYVVNRNRRGAPKAKPGPPGKAALVYADQQSDQDEPEAA